MENKRKITKLLLILLIVVGLSYCSQTKATADNWDGSVQNIGNNIGINFGNKHLQIPLPQMGNYTYGTTSSNGKIVTLRGVNTSNPNNRINWNFMMSYNGYEYKLTLRNFTLDNSNNNGIVVGRKLEINIQGINRIKSSIPYSGIISVFDGQMDIKGPGKLSVSGGEYGINITKGSLGIYSGQIISYGNLAGINVNEYVFLYGGELAMKGNTLALLGRLDYSGSYSSGGYIGKASMEMKDTSLIIANDIASNTFTYKNISIKCSHLGLVKVLANESTITTNGNIEYYKCESCGRYFLDSIKKKEINLSSTILPLKQIQKISTCFKNKTSNVVYVGKKINIKTKTVGKVKYLLSNKKLATINKKGILIIKKPGKITLTITAKAKGNYVETKKIIKLIAVNKYTYYKITNDTNYYSKHNKKSKVIGTLHYGEKIKVLTKYTYTDKKKSIWLKVKVAKKYYWINSKNTRKII